MNRIAMWMSCAAVGVIVGVACGPKVDEPVEQLEHRLAACATKCNAIYTTTCDFDALCEQDCGLNEKGTFPRPFDSAEECIESCADPFGVASSGWGYLGDGEDECVAEFEAHTNCVAALNCEDRLHYYTNIVVWSKADEYLCGPELYTMLTCEAEHPSPEED